MGRAAAPDWRCSAPYRFFDSRLPFPRCRSAGARGDAAAVRGRRLADAAAALLLRAWQRLQRRGSAASTARARLRSEPPFPRLVAAMFARAPVVREARRAASAAVCASASRAASSSSAAAAAASAPPPPPPPRRIFSGIQPTGVPHLGNYLGALRSWLELQRGEIAAAAPGTGAGAASAPPAHVFFSIVGLHALTVPQAGKQLRRERRAMLRCLLAIGIDPARCTLFHQEQVRRSERCMRRACGLGWARALQVVHERRRLAAVSHTPRPTGA